jgi:hypothetical protein
MMNRARPTHNFARLCLTLLLPLPLAASATAQQAPPPPVTDALARVRIEAVPRASSCLPADQRESDRGQVAGGNHVIRVLGTTVDKNISPRLRLTTGLLPTPNIAAQAGGIDHNIAAIAYIDFNPYMVLMRYGTVAQHIGHSTVFQFVCQSEP